MMLSLCGYTSECSIYTGLCWHIVCSYLAEDASITIADLPFPFSKNTSSLNCNHSEVIT